MTERPLRKLVELEMRRARPILTQTMLLGAVVLALLWALGWSTPGRASFVLGVIAVSGLWAVPTSIMRDKLDGGMEFLTALPIERTTLAAARLLAVLLFAVPAGAVGVLAIHVMYGSQFTGLGSVHAALVWFGALTLGSTVITALVVGVSCRLEVRHFSRLALIAFLAFVSLGELSDHLAPQWKPAALALAARPWFPQALVAGLLCAAALLLWLSFHLARTGFERYKPGRDRITW